MRGIALLIALLMIPAGSAQTLEWLGPSDGVANSPMFFAYRMDDGNGGLEGHVNVRLSVTLDGHTLFATEQLHEHEGFHTFTLTPPAEGDLQLHAVVAGAESIHTATVSESAATALPAFPGAGFRMGQNQNGANTITRGDGAMLVDGTNGWALVEGRAEGTTRFSAWQSASSGGTLMPGVAFEADGVFTDSPIQQSGRGAAFISAGTWPAARESEQPVVLPGLPRPPPCADTDMNVVLDANSLSPAGNPQFQEHASIRVAMPDRPYSQVAYVLYESLSEVSLRSILAVETVDPYAQAILLGDGPGAMRLLVSGQLGEGGREQCAIFFDITPNPAEPGTVTADLVPTATGLNVTFTPLDANGNILTHYEFDTRVLRLQDDAPGRLVYQGKLHGHPGTTSFELENLEPGDYRMWTHPSPQDPAAGPVAAPGPEGFVYTFTVPEAAAGESVYVFSKEPEVGQEKTTPLLGAPLLVIGLAGLCSRRR